MTPNLLKITPELTASVASKTAAAQTLLREIANNWSPAAFANSLGAEDMVLTDLIVKARLPIEIFSLDTGRLPLETYDLMAAVQQHYQLKLKVYFPQAEEVESFVRNHGINAFYESVTLRKACCYARKVEPLRRALASKRAWITGMRAEQAATRGNLALREYDEGNGLEKFNPLADWSEKEVWTYIKQHAVPYNALHDKFYPSIGCAPCSRAISPGEDIRSGRWWWESPESKECGLHVKATS
ncbi:MAG: phosphoadenylyl-sulfate reductase [Betaproteobacteria bacterium HGW-Betaproteobacteria-7]|jgi:phosphoadenosine phosphosulfate reductase|nr:MAG: phosphoadenylyl-sulfate reductase [Betaproteobacteria bacterium HGW-Betaproteobacteria-7]